MYSNVYTEQMCVWIADEYFLVTIQFVLNSFIQTCKMIKLYCDIKVTYINTNK